MTLYSLLELKLKTVQSPQTIIFISSFFLKPSSIYINKIRDRVFILSVLKLDPDPLQYHHHIIYEEKKEVRMWKYKQKT